MAFQFFLSFTRIIDENGEPVSGAKLNVYQAGTFDRLPSYTDNALSNLDSNPVEANGFGQFGAIFLPVDNYKFVLTDADDIEIWTRDDFGVTAAVTAGAGTQVDGNGALSIIRTTRTLTGTSYTAQNSDRTQYVIYSNAAGVTVTLPDPTSTEFTNGWFHEFGVGAGDVTFTSTADINGSASDLVVPANTGGFVHSDGTNYFINRFLPADIKLNQITAQTSSGLIIKNSLGDDVAKFGETGDETDILGELDMNTHVIKNVVNPTNAQDAATKTYVDGLSVKAWVIFNGSGTVAILDSFNVVSITDNGTGDYTINYTTAFSNTDYCTFGLSANNAPAAPIVVMENTNSVRQNSATRIYSLRSTGGGTVDSPIINFGVFA